MGGTVLCQGARPSASAKPSRVEPAASSPSIAPVLLTDEQSAASLGVSVRKFHELRVEDWMPRPVSLGPRCLRWVRAELEQAVAAMPRQERPAAEPAQLQLARAAGRTIVRDGKKVGA